jgi:hypothetical protein
MHGRRRAVLWDAILARGVTPAGLGARDTLRLEVCYPHGNDIDRRDAISSGLGWACALDTEFTGVQRLRETKDRGPEQKLVPFVMTEKAIPRQGMAIEGGGEVTSGSLSPMLEVGIGMGYVPAASSKAETGLVIDVRGKPRRAEVSRKPIYKRSPTAATESHPTIFSPRARLGPIGVTRRCSVSPGTRRTRSAAVHYEPPDVGAIVAKDSSYGEVESVKAVSDLISPPRARCRGKSGRRRARDRQRGPLRRRLADPHSHDDPGRARAPARRGRVQERPQEA